MTVPSLSRFLLNCQRFGQPKGVLAVARSPPACGELLPLFFHLRALFSLPTRVAFLNPSFWRPNRPMTLTRALPSTPPLVFFHRKSPPWPIFPSNFPAPRERALRLRTSPLKEAFLAFSFFPPKRDALPFPSRPFTLLPRRFFGAFFFFRDFGLRLICFQFLSAHPQIGGLFFSYFLPHDPP